MIGARWQSQFGRPIFEGYGLTEDSPLASYNHDFARRPGTVGTAIENFELRIVDDSDRPVAAGHLGRDRDPWTRCDEGVLEAR